MRPRFSKTLNIPIPATWDDTLNEIAGREFRPVTSVVRELLLAGLRNRGLDPLAKPDDGDSPLAA